MDYKNIIVNIGKYHYLIVNSSKSIILSSSNGKKKKKKNVKQNFMTGLWDCY